jgi:cation-transporting P-type ATPase I
VRNPFGALIRTAATAVTVPVAVGDVLAVSKEIFGGTPTRRCWQSDDRYYIEVRGLDTEQGPQVGSAVLAAVRSAPGIRSARLNVPLSRVIVNVDVDDTGPSMSTVCGIVADAEAPARPASGRSGERPTDLPADGVVRAGQMVAAAANAAGLATSLAGRMLMWPALPFGLTAAVALVDYQPRLRGIIEDRLGQHTADTALALASAAVYTLTQAPASLAVETVRHVVQIGEGVAGAQAWQRHEPALSDRVGDAGTGAVPQRPVPLPPGKIERHAARSGVVQGVAATAGLLIGNLNTAATAAVVTAPKAALNAREGFAATLGRGLADGYDVLPLRPQALRRLDRIDAVVLDPRALMTDELRVSRLRGMSDRDRGAAWQWAHEQLERGTLSPGWHRVPARASRHNGHAAGEVFIRHAHHPLAASVLGEIRRAGADAVSADVDELDDLRSSFDDLPAVSGPAAGSIDAALSQAVHALQRDGHTVALVTTGATRTRSAADLCIGVLNSGGRPPWQADLLVPDLAAVWQVLHALPAARKASQRGVEIATSASLLGTLLMIPGVRGRGPGPVTAGAAAGLINGLWLARGVLADAAPTPEIALEWHAMSPEQVRAELPPPQRGVPQTRSKLSTTASTSAGLVGAVAGPVSRLVGELAGAVRAELSDPLTPVLAVGSAASALLGSPIDAVLVGSVLTGNAVLAASQQVRAERLLRRLLAVQDPPARLVTEDGHDSVEATQLRRGDLIEVRPGEVVPADARIVAASDLEIDESSLTGESLPVAKQVDATPGAALGDRSCMVYAGTTVVAGTASAVVTATGAQSQARRTADVAPAQGSAVGLQGQLRDLTNRALPFSLAGGAVVSGLGLLRLVPLRQAVASGVAVTVAAVPEGLPLVATLAQQASARRLTRAGALVRAPRSVEALGRVDVVCFDKTGTLSKNQLRVSQVFTAAGFSAEQVLACAAVATPPKNGAHHEHATDAAVVAASDAHPSATDRDAATDRDSATARLSFRSGRPFSAALVGNELLLKGAPEVVLAACAGLDPHTVQAVREMAESGLRVIAVARRTVTAEQSRAAREADEMFVELCGSGLQFAGLLGLSDTPREESAAVLAALREQQIGIRLITGDHPVTATAIAAELGLPVTADQVISGTDWAALPRRGQEQAVRDRVVFARMTPEHKVQVVQTLERIGQVCAMVGDGANDAAAIRSATVGIGVASRGSDPARTAADVMLLDGRIGALLDAVDEGRQLWRRVQSAVAVLLGGNAGEVAFAVIGSALTGRSPLNTRQLLLVNMMTDALPAAALAVSPATRTSDNAGRGPDQAALWRMVAIRGTTTAAAATSAWLLAGFTLRPRRASTVALVSLVGTQLGQTLLDSHSPLVVTTAVGSLVSLGALISTPGVSQLLGCTPLGPVGWTQALTTAGIATAAAAVAPRLLTGLQSSISTIPSRHNTAYSSRNGISKTRATTFNGSAVPPLLVDDTSTTVPSVNV